MTKSVLGPRVIGDEEYLHQQSRNVAASALGGRMAADSGGSQWTPPAESGGGTAVEAAAPPTPPESEDVRMVRRALGHDYTATQVQTALIAGHHGEWTLIGKAADKHADKANALLDLVGMRDQAARACGVLAYGDLKRVELAVALANEPRLLLMDEPTAGMAPNERIALMDLAAEIAKSRSIAVLFTEHDMDVVFQHADRVIVLDRGRLIAEGTAPEVRANPQVQAVYLGTGTTYGAAG
jgi:ABC-type dipeptide/oligopeptide/nickel transport system ATPase component